MSATQQAQNANNNYENNNAKAKSLLEGRSLEAHTDAKVICIIVSLCPAVCWCMCVWLKCAHLYSVQSSANVENLK